MQQKSSHPPPHLAIMAGPSRGGRTSRSLGASGTRRGLARRGGAGAAQAGGARSRRQGVPGGTTAGGAQGVRKAQVGWEGCMEGVWGWSNYITYNYQLITQPFFAIFYLGIL